MNGRTDQAVLPQTHQDEFPAEYSLAGCSPAEPASASSATLILNQKPPVQLQNYSERQLSPPVRVSFPHAVQVSLPQVPPLCPSAPGSLVPHPVYLGEGLVGAQDGIPPDNHLAASVRFG